jgi:hypothetical protein
LSQRTPDYLAAVAEALGSPDFETPTFLGGLCVLEGFAVTSTSGGALAIAFVFAFGRAVAVAFAANAGEALSEATRAARINA